MLDFARAEMGICTALDEIGFPCYLLSASRNEQAHLVSTEVHESTSGHVFEER
jgi:hypothetical protein